MGFRIWSFRFRVGGLGFRVTGYGFRLGFRLGICAGLFEPAAQTPEQAGGRERREGRGLRSEERGARLQGSLPLPPLLAPPAGGSLPLPEKPDTCAWREGRELAEEGQRALGAGKGWAEGGATRQAGAGDGSSTPGQRGRETHTG